MKHLNKAVAILFVLLLLACSTTNRFSMQNLNYLYSENLDNHLVVKAFRQNDTLFDFYLGMIHQGNGNPAFSSDEVSLSYSIYGDNSDNDFLKEDSLFIPNEGFPAKPLKFSLSVPAGGIYHIRITVEDDEQERYTTVDLIKNTHFSEENYMLQDSTAEPVLFPYIGKPTDLKVLSNTIQADQVWVYYYKRSFYPAAPPFIYTKYPAYRFAPDSIFETGISGKNNSLIEINKGGFYHILADTNQREGITVFKYEDAFPEIKSARDMLLPLRYISSSEEFAKLSSADDPRLAVEEFWLKLKDNIERARYTIKRYYSRVEDANILFSSYLEGWKSDRGMVYIIYGPPTLVSRNDDRELWFYGEHNSPGVLRFEFIKVKNPFTDNDYQLVRSPNYKESWYINVDNWRR